MVDVRLFQTDDGGEVEIVNGRVTLDETPETAAYLSLFGGNERDDGSQATEPLQWWGNLLEEDRTRRLRSETQHLIRSLPAATGNLRRIEDAARRDLAWMNDALGADVAVLATIPTVNRVRLQVTLTIGDDRYAPSFEAQWGSA